MTRARRRAAPIAATVGAVLVLAGCGHDPGGAPAGMLPPTLTPGAGFAPVPCGDGGRGRCFPEEFTGPGFLALLREQSDWCADPGAARLAGVVDGCHGSVTNDGVTRQIDIGYDTVAGDANDPVKSVTVAATVTAESAVDVADPAGGVAELNVMGVGLALDAIWGDAGLREEAKAVYRDVQGQCVNHGGATLVTPSATLSSGFAVQCNTPMTVPSLEGSEQPLAFTTQTTTIAAPHETPFE